MVLKITTVFKPADLCLDDDKKDPVSRLGMKREVKVEQATKGCWLTHVLHSVNRSFSFGSGDSLRVKILSQTCNTQLFLEQDGCKVNMRCMSHFLGKGGTSIFSHHIYNILTGKEDLTFVLFCTSERVGTRYVCARVPEA